MWVKNWENRARLSIQQMETSRGAKKATYTVNPQTPIEISKFGSFFVFEMNEKYFFR